MARRDEGQLSRVLVWRYLIMPDLPVPPRAVPNWNGGDARNQGGDAEEGAFDAEGERKSRVAEAAR